MTDDDLLIARRAFDQNIAEDQRADRARMDAILQRLGGMEGSLLMIRQAHDSVQDHAQDIQGNRAM